MRQLRSHAALVASRNQRQVAAATPGIPEWWGQDVRNPDDVPALPLAPTTVADWWGRDERTNVPVLRQAEHPAPRSQPLTGPGTQPGGYDPNAVATSTESPHLRPYLGEPSIDQTLQDPFFEVQRAPGGEPYQGAPALYGLMRSGHTIDHVLREVARLEANPTYLAALQMELVDHGFLEPGTFTFGQRDGATTDAVAAMVLGKWTAADRSTDDYLQDRHTAYQDTLRTALENQLRASQGEAETQLQGIRDEIAGIDLRTSVITPEQAEQMLDTMSAELVGGRLDPQTKARYTAMLQEAQRQSQQQMMAPELARYQELLRQYRALTGQDDDDPTSVDPLAGAPNGDLDRFMDAIAHVESGGNPNARGPQTPHGQAWGMFQFMEPTWRHAAGQAGLDPTDRSPENQRRVARFLMASYYRQFGNWADVARAWYAGPGWRRHSQQTLDRPQIGNNPRSSINGYADHVIAIMGGYDGAAERAAGRFSGSADSMERQANTAIDRWATRMGPNPSPTLAAYAQGGRQLLAEAGEPPAPMTGEVSHIDPDSYLRSLVEEGNAEDISEYQYLVTYNAFRSLLGGIDG